MISISSRTGPESTLRRHGNSEVCSSVENLERMKSQRIANPLACLALITASMASCTSIKANPLQPGVTKVTIIENPKVIVDDYVPTIRECFLARGIETTMQPAASAEPGEVTMTYTALRTWDIGTYLSSANAVLMRDGAEIGSVYFEMVGKGGLDFAKFASTKSKVERMCNKLLTNYPAKSPAPQNSSPKQ